MLNIPTLLKNYDLKKITIGSLGGHSALDICRGAKQEGLKTVVVAKKGREKTYNQYYKTSQNQTGSVDECLIVDKFSDILLPEIQKKLQKLNTLFVHSRYFWVYFNDYAKVENEFQVPILGTRAMLKMEERDIKPNQYDLLKEANIRLPKIFAIPAITWQENCQKIFHNDLPLEDCQERQMDRLTLTKVNNASRAYERENFIASSWGEWSDIAAKKIMAGAITLSALQNAVVEEFVLGAQVNFNFFYSPLTNSLELMGTDTRRQTNLDGLLRLPANEQLKLPSAFRPHHIETGHVAVTVKESLVEKAYQAGEKFVKICQKYHPQGIIGPFALQGAIETDGQKEELVVFDVSLRIPGSPGSAYTPYAHYLFGENISMGQRLAREVKKAIKEKTLEKIVS